MVYTWSWTGGGTSDWSFPNGGWTVSSGWLENTTGSSGDVAIHPSESATGEWEFDADQSNARFSGMSIAIIGDQYTSGSNPDNGYELRLANFNSNFTVHLRRVDDGSPTTLLSSSGGHGNSKTVRVTRDANGEFDLWVNDTHEGSVQDDTYETSNVFLLSADGSGHRVDNISVTHDPPAVTDLSASSDTREVSLDWTSTGVESYAIYRGTASGSYSQIDSTSTPGYTDSGRLDGERYYYVVRSVNGSTESDNSNEVATTTDLLEVSDVSLTLDSPTGGTVTWTDESNNEDNFRVVLYEDGDWTERWDPGPNSESQPISVSKSANELQVRVCAETEHTTSSWTYSETYQTTVTNLAVADVDDTDVTLSWSGTDQEDEYKVFRAEASGSTESDYTLAGTTTNTSFVDSGRENGEPYYYRLAAVYGGETGELSGEVDVTTDLPAASDVLFDTSVDGEITVSWTRNDTSTDGTWGVYRSTDGTLGTQIASISDLSQTTYTDTGRADGEKYYYTVRRSTDHATSDVQAATVARLPPPTEFTVSNVTASTADYAWTANHNNGSTRVEYRPTTPDGEPDESWQEYTTVERSTETMTVDGLRNGEQYEGRVVAVTEHTETEDE